MHLRHDTCWPNAYRIRCLHGSVVKWSLIPNICLLLPLQVLRARARVRACVCVCVCVCYFLEVLFVSVCSFYPFFLREIIIIIIVVVIIIITIIDRFDVALFSGLKQG